MSCGLIRVHRFKRLSYTSDTLSLYLSSSTSTSFYNDGNLDLAGNRFPKPPWKYCRTCSKWQNEPLPERAAYGPHVCRCGQYSSFGMWRHTVTHGRGSEGKTDGVGSQYSDATSERVVSSITQADAQTSAASSRMN